MSGFSPLEILCNSSVSCPFLDPEHFHTNQPSTNGAANPTLWHRVCILPSGFRPPSCSYSCRYFLGQLHQGWICHGRRGACCPLQISSFSQSAAEAILMWLHNCYVHAGVESSTPCHNPGTKSCFFSHVFCSSVLTLYFTLAVIVSPCLDTSIHCRPVLLSVAPLSGITMGFMTFSVDQLLQPKKPGKLP